MEIPQWEDKTPKTNKVKDGRLVRPREQALHFYKQLRGTIKAFLKLNKQGRQPTDAVAEWTPKEDKDAGQE